MKLPRQVRLAARGPVRTRLRLAQARHPLLAPRTEAGPPDFVGIGVQRCGTTWWHSLIEQHPRVASLGMGVKELHFFDDAWRGDRDDATLAAAYATHFRRRPGQLAGEWTPRYLLDPWAVPRVRAAAPQARLLVMLRDPVARFVSGLGHTAKLSPQVGADEVTSAYVRGLYAEQLTRVLGLVPREQLLVLQLEQCLAEPQRHLDRTFAFLGLDPVPVPDHGNQNTAVTSLPADGALVSSVRPGYAEDAARLARLFPDDVDLDLWPGLRGAG